MGISIRVRVFRYVYFLVLLMSNSLLIFTRHMMHNNLQNVIEIVWFLGLLAGIVSYSVQRTLILSDDGSLHIGKAVYPAGTIKRITWSSGSRSTFQIVPNGKWTELRFITVSGWDGMRLAKARADVKFWAAQYGIEVAEPARGKHRKA